MQTHSLNINSIDIDPTRFRGVNEEDVEFILQSVKRNATDSWNGLITPIAVEFIEGVPHLRAGRQRLEVFFRLSKENPRYNEIPAVSFGDMNPLQRRVVELEENIHRADFTDLEKVKGVNEIHNLMKEMNPDWTMEQTSTYLGFKHRGWISMMTKVAAHVEKEPEGVAANLLKMKGTRGNITQAYKEIVAKDRKAAEAVLAEMFLQTQKQQVESGEDGAEKSAAGMCFQGSCLDLIKEVPDSSIYLIHTDPPYGINFDILEKADNKTEMYQGDTLAQSTTLWTALAPELFRVAQADSFAVVWVSFVQMPMIRAEMEKAGWECGRKPFVWVKESQWASYAPSKWFASAYDTALIFAKGSPTLSQQGKPDFSAFPPLTPHLKTHPLERPVAMLAELMGRFLVPGQTVLDPFMGSGSTLLAALALKCNPVGFERDEAFFNSAKANVVRALKRG